MSSNILVSKKYVKAIMSSAEGGSLEALLSELHSILPAFKSEKFVDIIASQSIAINEKIDFVLSLFSNPSSSTANLIKLLGEKKRLFLLPEIVSIIDDELSMKNNNYSGKVFSNIDLTDTYLQGLSQSLSAKFDKNITLAFSKSNYDGVKVDIEGLGVEIGFSKDRFKKSISDYVLKAV